MASFVPPQVDHNLYTPILPQDNVMQIFSLLDQKQQLYNQGVKSAQNKISSMLNLENEVTTEPVKEMVTDFNKKANDIVKQYANLDFSLQGNVKLIDNIYDPLLDNSLFLYDYKATKHLNNEYNVAFGYRDSSDDKTRDLFNQTNLDALTIKKRNLAGAKSEREIKSYSEDAMNTNYTPYYNVEEELVNYIGKLGKDYFDVKRDVANNWVITTTINGKEQQFPSLHTFVKSFLSDKANTQLEIESQVGFYNELRNSGTSKEQFLSDQLNTSIGQYEEYTKSLQDYISDVTEKLSSYPTDESKLTDVQAEKVAAYKAALESAQEKLDVNQKTLKNLDEYMVKAEKGEIEYSRFYDAAENLYVKNNVENRIKGLAEALVKPESFEVKKNEAYATMIQENRLARELNFKIAEAQQKQLLEEAKMEQERGLKLLELGLAKLNPDGSISLLNAGGMGEDTWLEPAEGPTTVTPTDITGVNAEVDKVLQDQFENTYASSTNVLNAFSAVNNNPLTLEENNWLKETLKTQGTKTIAQLIKEGGSKAQGIFNKAGLTNTSETLIKGVAKVVKSAEDYINNTTPQQAGNRLGYYNTLATTLNDYNAKSLLSTVQTENIKKSVQKSLDKFYKKYPEYKGLLSIDENGKISQTHEKQYKSFQDHTGVIVPIGSKNRNPNYRGPNSGDREYLKPGNSTSVQDRFNEFLKTQEGSVGAIGNYTKKVLASDAGTFSWLRDPKNKKVYLNPTSYELTEDEYTNSKYYQGGNNFGGGEWTSTDETETDTYNTIVSRYLNSIDDQRYNLPNKNLMVYGRRVETKKGVTTIFPTAEYLKYIFGAGTIDGKTMDKDALVDQPEFKKLIQNISKYGINIKTPGQSDESALNILSYINTGGIIPIKSTVGSRNMVFKLQSDYNTKQPVIEGTFDNPNDIFLLEDLTYKIENNTVIPSSSSSAFSYYQTPVTPGLVDASLITTSKKNAYTQLTFNNNRNNAEWVAGLQQYLKQYKRPSDTITGKDILAYLAKK